MQRPVTARAAAPLCLLLAVSCGDETPSGPTPEQLRQQLAPRASPSTWEDLDPARPGHRLRDPRTGIVFVRVPPGEFTMGSEDLPEERPVHRVRLTRPFLLAETEVTVAQWRNHVERHRGDASVPVSAPGPEHPMSAGFTDAERFCKTYGYRLPTEAEWHWACVGGFPAGEEPWRSETALQDHAWFHLNAGEGTLPVRGRRPNSFGLYDTLGNVWEWCADYHTPNYGADLPEVSVDPRGPEKGFTHVLRGGSWFTVPAPRPDLRLTDFPDQRNSFYGFRPARTVE